MERPGVAVSTKETPRRALFAIWVMVGCGGRVEAPQPEAGFGGRNSAASGGAISGGNAGSAGSEDCVPPEQWIDLPDCAYIDGCRPAGGPYVKCAASRDCAWVFEDVLPDMPSYSLFLCGQDYDVRLNGSEGDWTLSADRTRVVLGSSLCQRFSRTGAALPAGFGLPLYTFEQDRCTYGNFTTVTE